MDTEDQPSKMREKERKEDRAEPSPSHYRKENGAQRPEKAAMLDQEAEFTVLSVMG